MIGWRRMLFILVMILIILTTIIASVRATPVFSEKDLKVYLNDGESKTVSTIIYDVDGISMDLVQIKVLPHPYYKDVPTHIRGIKKTLIDDYAVLVEFEVFVPNTQDIGFHREIMVLNDVQKLNLGITNDITTIASIKNFFNKDIKFGNNYMSFSMLLTILISMIGVFLLFYMYERIKK